jgi:hypothetical protein
MTTVEANVSKFGPPLSELRHAGHVFEYNGGLHPVKVWCAGVTPSEDCPEYKIRVRKWNIDHGQGEDTAESDRLESLGFRTPVRLLVHAPHQFRTQHADRITCPGDKPYGDCPVVIAVERAHREGIWYGTQLDPFPGPTGEGTEDLERIRAWYERHPDAAAVGSPNSPCEHSNDTVADTAESQPACDRPEEELIRWWRETSYRDIHTSIDKVNDYGGYNMVFMGQALWYFAKNARNLPDNPTPGYLQELAIWFYEIGKLGRALVAITGGKPPSDDTVYDTGYYAMMIRRIRSFGYWPHPSVR